MLSAVFGNRVFTRLAALAGKPSMVMGTITVSSRPGLPASRPYLKSLASVPSGDSCTPGHAVEWLARTQLTPADAADPLKNPDGDPAGSWCETEFTGTGFPKVFYLRYHMYRLYFPLMAMGRFVQARVAGA